MYLSNLENEIISHLYFRVLVERKEICLVKKKERKFNGTSLSNSDRTDIFLYQVGLFDVCSNVDKSKKKNKKRKGKKMKRATAQG